MPIEIDSSEIIAYLACRTDSNEFGILAIEWKKLTLQ